MSWSLCDQRRRKWVIVGVFLSTSVSFTLSFFASDWIEPSEFRFSSPLGLHLGELFLSWTVLQADRDEKRIKKQIKSVYCIRLEEKCTTASSI